MSILEKVKGIVLNKVYTVKELDDKMVNMNFRSEVVTINYLMKIRKTISVYYYNLTTTEIVIVDITVINRTLVKVTDVY